MLVASRLCIIDATFNFFLFSISPLDLDVLVLSLTGVIGYCGVVYNKKTFLVTYILLHTFVSIVRILILINEPSYIVIISMIHQCFMSFYIMNYTKNMNNNIELYDSIV